MVKALGIVNFSGNHIWVNGLQDYRPIGAFSFLGRYRVIDFPISNMSNSGIDRIEVYIRSKPRSVVEHVGTGRHYSINSKKGRVHLLFSDSPSENNDIYNTDIAAYWSNLECIEGEEAEYVVIAPSYMVYSMDYRELLNNHIKSGADVTLLYHNADNAHEDYLNCHAVKLNRQNGVLSLEQNRGSEKNRNIFMDTYVMKKTVFIELIKKARAVSSMYTLADIVHQECENLDIRGVEHKGYFAAITGFKNYFDANLSLLDYKEATELFKEDWPIYTRTNDSCPTQYFESASVRKSVVSNGCLIEGTVENSVIGRGCIIKEGAVVKNSVVLPGTFIGENVHLENVVVDKHARLVHENKLISNEEHPGYIKRKDVL